MFQSRYLPVLEAKSPSEFHAATLRFATELGFDLFSCSTIIDHAARTSDFITTGNLPPGYKVFHEDNELHQVDPVGQHCKRSSLPILWDRSTYQAAGQLNKWELQASFGLCFGVALAMHFPNGLHFMIGVERDQRLPTREAHRERLAAELHFFALHAQDSALRLFVPRKLAAEERPTLTERELECLRWTMEGKTAWELGRILGIAENTVIRHLHSATQKLDVTGKHQAVLKALRFGLIR